MPAREAREIAYLLDDFLTPTTTFITHEVRYLYNSGWPIQVCVLGRCVKSQIDPENVDLLPIAKFTRPTNVLGILFGNLFALIKYPVRYFATLWQIVRLTSHNHAQCIRAVGHFLEGIPLGKTMMAKGIRRVHVHFAGRAATAALSIRGVFGIPYSVTTHAYDLFVDSRDNSCKESIARIESGRKPHTLLNLKLSCAERIVSISEFNYQIMTGKLGINPEKIQIVRCGINTTRFQPRRQLGNAFPTILSVGGLVEKKGHEVLIRACAHLKEQGFRLMCKIIGVGPLRERLLSLSKSLRAEDCIQLCGLVHHSELPRHLEEADVFALACLPGKDGNMDGIPVALMEAMAMEVPVVTTKLSGIPELVESGVSGFLLEPGDSRGLADRIGELLGDPQLRQRMGRRGREKVLEDYDEAKNLPLVTEVLFRDVEGVRVRWIDKRISS